MSQHRPPSAQDRQFLLALKAALRAPHEGPDAMPRKAIWLDLRIAESTYSRWLSNEELDWIPSLLDLRRIINLSGDPAPLRVLAAWAGQGFDLAPSGPGGELGNSEAHRLLASEAGAAGTLLHRLGEDLADDGRLDAAEAAQTLPAAREQLRVAQRLVDTLGRVAGGAQ